jgi:predicted nucleotidyltransferase
MVAKAYYIRVPQPMHCFSSEKCGLEDIKPKCDKLRIFIFGSFITIKKEPNDIDVLINLVPNADNVYPMMKERIHTKYPDKVDIKYVKTQLFLIDAESTIKHFNENPLNIKDEIKINRAVEITGL